MGWVIVNNLLGGIGMVLRRSLLLLIALLLPAIAFATTKHIVKKGDNLYDLSREYGVSVEDIKTFNKLSNIDLGIGDELLIPVSNKDGNNNYAVKSGDTISQIAEKFGIKTKDLKSANKLKNDNLLIGQSLYIPLQNNAASEVVVSEKSIEKDLLEKIIAIEAQQAVVEIHEPNRRDKIKDGMVKLLEQHVGADKYDQNRLEQELIYYIEKIDISEERVRLKNHCDYFKAMLKDADPCKGKKLSFILQEIGREINTTGSKANDVDIQKAVIMMKDELEKAKEQILNVL